MTSISTVTDILSHRIEGAPVRSGKWMVWSCTKSEQTMSKFIGRLRDEGVTSFCRGGKFGVLASDIDTEATEAASELASALR